jgi:hypothetical protein
MSYDVKGPKAPKTQTMPKQKLKDDIEHSASTGVNHMGKPDVSSEAKMDPHHQAKKNVLQHLSDSMKRHMGEGIKDHLSKPVKSVTVESPDAAGLKKGLDIASQLSPKIDEMSKAAEGIMGKEEPPRDMDEAAMDSEESSNDMPDDHAELMAEHMNQDEDSTDNLEALKKHLAKRV